MTRLPYLFLLLWTPLAWSLEYKNTSELSIVVTNGNSSLKTYNSKTKNKFLMGKDVVTLSGHYTLGTSNQNLSARNWDLKLRYDRLLTDPTSLFLSEQVEGDKFSGYITRFNTDVGIRHRLVKSETAKLFGEFGYRYIVEKSTSGTTRRLSRLRLQFDGERQFTETLFAQGKIAYLPNLSSFSDYLLNFEISLRNKLSSTFSLKLGYLGKYASLPTAVTRKKLDTSFTTSLLADF